MEGSIALTVLFIIYLISAWYWSTHKSWKGRPNVIHIPPTTPIIDKEKEVDMSNPRKVKFKCKKCVFLQNGECLRGIPEAPKVLYCKVFVNRKSHEGKMMRREIAAVMEAGGSCNVSGVDFDMGEEKTTVIPAGTKREEILMSNIKV